MPTDADGWIRFDDSSAPSPVVVEKN